MTLDKQKLLELAERCEQATGPDRELDYAIFKAMARKDAPNHWRPNDGDFFTASLDTALTLVPEGCVWNAGNDTGAAWAHVWTDGPDYDGMIPGSRAVTPALALCAAALRAQSMEAHNNG